MFKSIEKTFKISSVFIISLSLIAACSSKNNTKTDTILKTGSPEVAAQPALPHLAQFSLPKINPSSLAEGEAKPIILANGADVLIEKRGGLLRLQMEATFSREAYAYLVRNRGGASDAEFGAILAHEIDKAVTQLPKGSLSLKVLPEVGYFTFWLPLTDAAVSALKSTHFDQEYLVSPVTLSLNEIKAIQDTTPSLEGATLHRDGRDGTAGFSGLERIGAREFVKIAKQDIGGEVAIDGSRVNVGVTDSGITYNHPVFRSGLDNKIVRIKYMRDFTGEGRIYFNTASKFEVTVPSAGDESDLTINAQIISTPKLPAAPAGDDLVDVKGLNVKVSLELKAILTKAGSGAVLGVLREDVFQSDSEAVDINANGKLDDRLFVILIPGKTPAEDVLYLDSTGTGDFRNAKPLGDWNKTKSMISVYAEKFGFDLRVEALASKDGKAKIPVRSASIVGFDPGNHGSHVSGIIAGVQTLLSDPKGTLAGGVAPEANIFLNRICANNGGCNATEAFTDLILNAGVEVINMSIGGLSPFNDGYGVQETVMNRLTATKNVLFIVSAGNDGPGRQTVSSPSLARLSLSVGASASKSLIERQYQRPGLGTGPANLDPEDDFMLFFSSRGPTAAGGFKPNLVAPGTELSSVQFNTAPGGRSGLDVYWGTSMAAPTATGAYALLLDAIKKYNERNPSKPLTTDAILLREVLIESAHPFDVATFDPLTGTFKPGQYTWIDEGKGLLSLPNAWKKLFELRDNTVPSSVTASGDDTNPTPVELDYRVLTSIKPPNGIAYNGSRAYALDDDAAKRAPAFGTGLYLDFYAKDTFQQVNVIRSLREGAEAQPNAGKWAVQLADSADEFVLKTVIYGSDKEWIKAGVLDSRACWGSPTANLTIVSQGATIQQNPDGTGVLVPFEPSVLNVCLNRKVISNQLPPGDHGALISAYRTKNGKTSAIPSFVVPVFMTVPHRILASSTAYEVQGSVKSFGVSRNYVTIPKGTSLVKITLEAPSLKTDANGNGVEDCSGVELMTLEGNNKAKASETRTQLRVSNCEFNGTPKALSDAGRTITLTRVSPLPGIWDLHIFGRYQYPESKFKLRVDYVVASTDKALIEGNTSALTGSVVLTVKESTVQVLPDVKKSTFEINGLFAKTQSQVAKGDFVIVPGPNGIFRSYPEDTKAVTITTGGSPGNDIDLLILECPIGTTSAKDPACEKAASSGGPTDEESATFKPKANKIYAARVDGFDVKDAGVFTSTELIRLTPEYGSVSISGADNVFVIKYALTPEQLAAGKIANLDLFKSGKYKVAGSLQVKTAAGDLLSTVPVLISNQ